MANKVTKRERYEQIKVLLADNAEIVAFCDHELELLAKKNSADKKPTANQLANEGIKADILDVMEDNHLYTVTEIQKSLGSDFSNQRVSALLRQLIADGAVVRTEDKRKAYFSKAVAE